MESLWWSCLRAIWCSCGWGLPRIRRHGTWVGSSATYCRRFLQIAGRNPPYTLDDSVGWLFLLLGQYKSAQVSPDIIGQIQSKEKEEEL